MLIMSSFNAGTPAQGTSASNVQSSKSKWPANGLSIGYIDPKKVIDALELLEMEEPNTFNMCLSILLQKTSDSDSENVQLEKYPKFLPVILKIMDGINVLKNYYVENLLKEMSVANEGVPRDDHEGHIRAAVEMLAPPGQRRREAWPAHALPCMHDEIFKVLP